MQTESQASSRNEIINTTEEINEMENIEIIGKSTKQSVCSQKRSKKLINVKLDQRGKKED